MATLESFASGSVVVARNDARREIIITGGVLTINGVLDDLPGNGSGWTIRCRSGGGIRSTTGASGTLGGGVQSLKIIEQAAGSDGALSWTASHTWGSDNWSASNGANARFAGDSTNRLKYSNIFWLVEHRTGRNDFDIARGTASNGSAGPSVELNGVRLIQRRATGTTQINFNHYGSRNASITINPNCGFGFSVRNETLSHAWEFSVAPGDGVTIEGLQSDDIAAADLPHGVDNGVVGARIACRIAANSTLTLDQLNTPDIACVDAPSTATLVLNNPVGLPTRTPNWTPQYSGNMIVNRDVPFEFSGATPTGHLYAVSQAASNGQDADIAIPSSGSATIRLRTNYSAHQATGGAWTSTDSYRFHAVGLHFAKYYSGTTNISIGNSPSTRSVALTAFTLPDGTAASSKTSGAVSSAADIVNALKTYEVSNPAYPSLATRLVSIANASEVQIATAELVLDSSASEFIARSSNTITLQCSTSGVSASNGVGLINLGLSYTPPAATLALLNLPTTTSAGTSSQLTISAHASEVIGVFKNDGTKLGSNSFAADGDWTLQISAADSAANTRVGLARAGYAAAGRTLDLSSGGSYAETFAALVEIPGGKYKSTANASNLIGGSIHISSANPFEPGDLTLRVSNGHSSAFDVFKAYSDAVAASNGEGTRVPAFGRQPLDITALDGQPGNVFLGPDCTFQRGLPVSSNTSAFIDAFVYGGVGGDPVHDATANPIFYSPAVSSSGGGGSVDLAPTNAAIAAVKTETQVLRYQNRLLLQNAPLDPLPAPWTPDLILTGAPGMGYVHDVESRNWPVRGLDVSVRSGIDDDDGIVSGNIVFPAAANGIVQADTYRREGGNIETFTDEAAFQFGFKPTAFHATERQRLGTFGGMSFFVNPSTGTTATIRVGSNAVDFVDTTLTLTLNQFSVIAGCIAKKRPTEDEFPYVNLAVDGSAPVQINASSDEARGRVGTLATHFSIGAPNSSIVGEVREFLFHPNKERHIAQLPVDHADYPLNADQIRPQGWIPPTGLVYDPDAVVYQVPDSNTAQPERTQGNAVDLVEDAVGQANAKLDELPRNTASAVVSNTSQTADQNGNLLARIKWLTENHDDANAVASAVGARTIPNSPAAGSYDAALATASGYTIPTPPTAASIATATWAQDIRNAAANTAANRLNETSTHGAPADAPEAADIAEAVRDVAISGAASGSLGAAINNLEGNAHVVTIANAVVAAYKADEVETGVSRADAERITLAVLGGTTSVAGDNVSYNSLTTGTPAVRLTQTLGATDGVRSAATLPSD